MKEIFISYARKDQSRVKPIAKALENIGWSVWWDEKIPPGRKFSDVIEEEITNAKCVIVIWSIASVKSNFVQTEASIGLERDILIPAKIDEVKPPFEFRHIQAADLIDWTGELNHENFQMLINSLTKKIGAPKVHGPLPNPRKIKPGSLIPDEEIITAPSGFINTKLQSGCYDLFIDSGDVAKAQGKLEEAAEHYYDGLSTMKKLVAGDPNNIRWQIKLTIALIRLGEIEETQGKLSKAEQHYSEALPIMKKVVEDDPEKDDWKVDLLAVYKHLSNVAKVQCKLGKAEEWLSEARMTFAPLLDKKK